MGSGRTFDENVVRFAIAFFFFLLFIVVMVPVQILYFIPYFCFKKFFFSRDMHVMSPMEWFGKVAKAAIVRD